MEGTVGEMGRRVRHAGRICTGLWEHRCLTRVDLDDVQVGSEFFGSQTKIEDPILFRGTVGV